MVAQCSMEAVAFIAPSDYAPFAERPDPFAGRPLARMLHTAGIPILSKRSVRRGQRHYKMRFCREQAASMAEFAAEHRDLPQYSQEEIYWSLIKDTRWRTFSLEEYDKLTVNPSLLTVSTLEAPPIPADARDVITEALMRMPGAEVEVEAFYTDPDVAIKYGTERYYILHF